MFAIALAAAVPARAEEPAFGRTGQWVVSGWVAAELEIGSGFLGGDGTEHAWSLAFSPSVLRFVSTDFAVGVALGALYENSATNAFPYTEVELSGSFGAGLNVPLTAGISLFPQLWLGLGHMRRRYLEVVPPVLVYRDPTFADADPDDTLAGWFASVQLPLPVHVQLGAATYLAIGPRLRLRAPFDEGSGLVRVGLSAGFGGFF